MRFLTRRLWVAVWGLITMAIVMIVNTACDAFATQSSADAQKAGSSELAQSAVVSNSVNIQGFQFHPTPITVKRGGSVTFTNQDAVPHTITPEQGAHFTGTGRLGQNNSKQVVFSQVGEQDYFCEIHPSMKGKVMVTN